MSLAGLLAVAMGAALGAWLRWALGATLNPVFPTVPLGTLAANLLGGYLIGATIAALGHFDALGPEVRLFVITGFLGALTTFSTFSAEASTLLARGQYGWAAALIAGHVTGSIIMTFAGIATLRVIVR